MYRQYENPFKLEEQLKRMQARYEEAFQNGCDDEYLFDLHEEIECLKERINFAWQDDEYDENYAREMGYYPYGDCELSEGGWQ